jgi:FAD/FMN-containing dehydrogenase/Fe-S oxidoreductase
MKCLFLRQIHTNLQNAIFSQLQEQLEGKLQWDQGTRAMYATDGSVYRKLPLGVAYPKDIEDLKKIVTWAQTHQISLIPRTAGTSLAGQCVGEGLVVDVSRHWTKIIELNVEARTVVVQPGVIRDELNAYLKPYGLFFGPNTSTSNRCMIGGMVGNNSSGTTSIKYGVTRDKVVSLEVLLSDGSTTQINELTTEQWKQKIEQDNFEGTLYRGLKDLLAPREVQERIVEAFPKKEIHRRNTGYAVDLLFDSEFLGGDKPGINLIPLLCGSEGTLAFTTSITLKLDPLPPAVGAMMVTHYHSIEDCLSDVYPLMQEGLYSCEMMDKVILDCTKNNREQQANRYFVEGDPAAVLMLEVRADDQEQLEQKLVQLNARVSESGLSYAQPVLAQSEITKAETLRKAGLGLLGNMVGDRKAVACIEDTAVALADLKFFIGEFSELMRRYKQDAVYYAHAGAGEIHLRPILNLKKSEDVVLFRSITTEVAALTKKYKGSFSGEHGDGIVRAEFIPMLIGTENYEVLKSVKNLFDPHHLFNPGKIVEAYKMDESLRYEVDREEPEVNTFLDFSDKLGILRAAEACNGSGDCRKTHHAAGGMCPSYQATKEEKDTTRGRANVLREMITHGGMTKPDHAEIVKDSLDLCVGCKACASECPSNVDMTTMKAEFLYQYQELNGYPLRAKFFAYSGVINQMAQKVAPLANAVNGSSFFSSLLKKALGIAPARHIPRVYRQRFNQMHQSLLAQYQPTGKEVVLFIDEFTNTLDVPVGEDALALLIRLGYQVKLYQGDSGRTFLSKGFLKQAQDLAQKNLNNLSPYIAKSMPVLGIEPSAVLSFKDEYPRMLSGDSRVADLAKSSMTIEHFLAQEAAQGTISSKQFTRSNKEIKVHCHCHQKALENAKDTFDLLNLPEKYSVALINSGCCGMAGSFGYEKEHYQVSMDIGNLRLFPAIRKAEKHVEIAANGTSCRHQIEDGTKKKAKHPVTLLLEALA